MNKDDFIKKFQNVARKIDITYTNIDYYYEAFTHPSFANEQNVKHYERMEFLGDAILGFLVAEYIFQNENISEGDMTKLRANFVCTQANAEYCLELGLDACLMLGKGAKEHNEDSQAVLADVFESFLGALYLDHGLNYVRTFLTRFLYPKILSKKIEFFIDYKSQLQEYIHTESRKSVQYTVILEKGLPHQKIFDVAVMLEGLRLGVGSGKTKKEAEQNAAKNALEKMVR